MRLSLIISCLILASPFVGTQSQAKEAGKNFPSSARVGLDVYRMEQATYDRSERLAYSVGYNWAFASYMRLDNYFFYAPDERRNETEVKLREDYQMLSSSLAMTYPLLFRWVAAAGPIYIQSKSTLKFRDESDSSKVSQWGHRLHFAAEYVIDSCCELAVNLGIISRTYDDKIDWSYGLAYSQNIGPIRSATATKTPRRGPR